MSLPDYSTVLRSIKSDDFTSFQCIDLLRRFVDNVGIHHILVKKLHTFPYDELEFFIPQFVQLLVSFETDSMALEDFLIEYCSKYPHFSLIVFWNLQAYVFELRNDPESYSFQTVRKFINKLQNIIFNTDVTATRNEGFRENLHPALILCGAIGSCFALPKGNDYISPLIKSQSKQQKSFVFKLANFQKTLTRNLTLKNKKMSIDHEQTEGSDDEQGTQSARQSQESKNSLVRSLRKESLTMPSDESDFFTTDDESDIRKIDEVTESKTLKTRSLSLSENRLKEIENLNINTTIKSRRHSKKLQLGSKSILNSSDSYTINSQSLPDLTRQNSSLRPYISPTESESSLSFPCTTSSTNPGDPSTKGSANSNGFTYNELVKMLHVNYAKKETEFIMALQNISLRLSQVPKEARLSALRAELSIINDTLIPSEVDVPQLLPITSNRNKKYHKILKLSINEACVLNSAERVPFLLLIEYLSDEIDFNPFSQYNQNIISNKNNAQQPYAFNEGTADFPEKETPRSKAPDAIGISESIEAISHGFEAETDLSDLPTSINSNEKLDDQFRSSKVFNCDSRGVSPSTSNSIGDIPTKSLTEQMRIASVMLQQLNNSGQSSSEQSLAIKNRIIQSMISLQDQFDSIDYEKLNQLRGDKPDAGQRKLENDFKLAEDWNSKKKRIRQSSVYGHLKGWDLCSVIAKNGDDLPQEAFACQLISLISNIWKKENVDAWTKRMKILTTSANTGLVETITNAMSIHSIKKSLTEISISEGENSKGRIFTLQDYFRKMYGEESSRKYKVAQENFAKSLASYSIICYILQIKDRHNGNIMLDNEGHIIHIDFGFLLSNSPGSVGFEAAPFKLTLEYAELLGGVDSDHYKLFKDICKQCYAALRKHSEQIISIVELMQKDSALPCFKNGENTSVLLKQRLQLQLSDDEADAYVESMLIGKSLGSMYTRLYDQFQMVTQGIYS